MFAGPDYPSYPATGGCTDARDAPIAGHGGSEGGTIDGSAGQPKGSAGEGNPPERLRASFERQGLIRLLGARVVGAGPSPCEFEVPLSEKLTQQERYLHGAVIGALRDTAGGYAALTVASPDREVLTVEYKVYILAPTYGEKSIARGEVVTAGRRLFVCKAEVSAVAAGG